MKNKFLIFGVIVLVLLLSVAVIIKFNKTENDIQRSNVDLSKYRSTEIPEECRLPEYENNLDSWREHLSHHQNTLYCLDYYK